MSCRGLVRLATAQLPLSSAICSRCCSSLAVLTTKSSLPTARSQPPASDPDYDWISPPDAVSKLRTVRLRSCEQETSVERDYRMQFEATQLWNEEFWRRHNAAFHEQQRVFMSGQTEDVNADDLSKFYKTFLDQRWSVHASYNWQWYKRHFTLLWPAVKATVRRKQRMMMNKKLQ